MYVELHNYQEIEQKILFFKLKSIFNLDNTDAIDRKIAGIYIIYKDDICLYVGQSTNLASRIATHIKGKYSEATKINVLNIEDIGWNDFKERSKESQESILLNTEKYVMSILNPIENININHDMVTAIEKIPNSEISKEYVEYSYLLHMNKKDNEEVLLIKSQEGVFDYFLEKIKMNVDYLEILLTDLDLLQSPLIEEIECIQEDIKNG